MNNYVYSIPGTRMSPTEGKSMAAEDFESRVVNKISEIVCDCLQINHNDRRIVQTLLANELSPALNNRDENRPGLLQQYFAHELEGVAESLKSSFKIPKEIRVRHDRHIHSKMSEIIDYVEKNYVKVEDIKSDGTFETIFDSRHKPIAAARSIFSDTTEGECVEECDMEPSSDMCERES